MKKYLIISLIFALTIFSLGFAEEEKPIISGKVEQIAGDESYIVVNGNKILVTEEFMEEFYPEIGDKVKIAIENTAQGPKAIDCEYIFEDEPESYEYEEEGASSDQYSPESSGEMESEY